MVIFGYKNIVQRIIIPAHPHFRFVAVFFQFVLQHVGGQRELRKRAIQPSMQVFPGGVHIQGAAILSVALTGAKKSSHRFKPYKMLKTECRTGVFERFRKDHRQQSTQGDIGTLFAIGKFPT